MDTWFWIISIVVWILVLPLLAFELWLTKRRAHKYASALKQIADISDDDAGAKQARNMARQLVYDWKW